MSAPCQGAIGRFKNPQLTGLVAAGARIPGGRPLSESPGPVSGSLGTLCLRPVSPHPGIFGSRGSRGRRAGIRVILALLLWKAG